MTRRECGRSQQIWRCLEYMRVRIWAASFGGHMKFWSLELDAVCMYGGGGSANGGRFVRERSGVHMSTVVGGVSSPERNSGLGQGSARTGFLQASTSPMEDSGGRGGQCRAARFVWLRRRRVVEEYIALALVRGCLYSTVRVCEAKQCSKVLSSGHLSRHRSTCKVTSAAAAIHLHLHLHLHHRPSLPPHFAGPPYARSQRTRRPPARGRTQNSPLRRLLHRSRRNFSPRLPGPSTTLC